MVALRTLHLVAVIALGVVLIGGSVPAGWSPAWVGAAVLVTGAAMLLLDLLADHGHLRSVAGLTAVLKLILVAVLASWPAPALFWALVVLSGVVSHAPARFRHFVVLPGDDPVETPGDHVGAPKTPGEGSDPRG
jgi:hypothetical protein